MEDMPVLLGVSLVLIQAMVQNTVLPIFQIGIINVIMVASIITIDMGNLIMIIESGDIRAAANFPKMMEVINNDE